MRESGNVGYLGIADDLRQMAVAFDIAWELLGSDVDRCDDAKRTLAANIVANFKRGERDAERLADLAVTELISATGEAAFDRSTRYAT